MSTGAVRRTVKWTSVASLAVEYWKCAEKRCGIAAHVGSEHVFPAVTAGGFVYDNGATQAFDIPGATTYAEAGRYTHGEGCLDGDGWLCSF